MSLYLLYLFFQISKQQEMMFPMKLLAVIGGYTHNDSHGIPSIKQR